MDPGEPGASITGATLPRPNLVAAEICMNDGDINPRYNSLSQAVQAERVPGLLNIDIKWTHDG